LKRRSEKRFVYEVWDVEHELREDRS
jgi:hypothetical protein